MRISVLSLLFFSFFLHSQTIQKKEFYSDRERGFFWHETKPKPEIEKKEEAPKLPASAPSNPIKKEVKPFGVDHIRESIPRLRDAAIENPSDVNLLKYYVMTRQMNDKATEFADATRMIFLKYPQLSETKLMPTQVAALTMRRRETSLAVDNIIRGIGGRASVFYFYKDSCIYCRKFGPLLSMLRSSTGIGVLPISLDGLPPTGNLPPFRLANELPPAFLDQLNITSTPTTFLIDHQSNEFMLIADEFVALSTVKERILLLAYDKKWIDKAAYEKTRNVLRQSFIKEQQLNLADGTSDPDEALDEFVSHVFGVNSVKTTKSTKEVELHE